MLPLVRTCSGMRSACCRIARLTWATDRRLQAAGNAFAHSLAINPELTGDRRDRQSLSMKIKNHDDFPKLDHRTAPSCPAERNCVIDCAPWGWRHYQLGNFQNGTSGENNSGINRALKLMRARPVAAAGGSQAALHHQSAPREQLVWRDAMSASHEAPHHARPEGVPDHTNLLGCCPTPAALNRRNDLNTIRSVVIDAGPDRQLGCAKY
jgi:hypothetical protein